MQSVVYNVKKFYSKYYIHNILSFYDVFDLEDQTFLLLLYV